MIDFNAATFAPVFALYGVTATLTPNHIGGPFPFPVIDRTRGMVVELDGGAVETYEAAALARMDDLTNAGVYVASDLDGGTLSMNGEDWTVIAHRRLPTPEGRANGLLLIVLAPSGGS